MRTLPPLHSEGIVGFFPEMVDMQTGRLSQRMINHDTQHKHYQQQWLRETRIQEATYLCVRWLICETNKPGFRSYSVRKSSQILWQLQFRAWVNATHAVSIFGVLRPELLQRCRLCRLYRGNLNSVGHQKSWLIVWIVIDICWYLISGYF